MGVRREDGRPGNLAKARLEGWAGCPFSFSTKTERHTVMSYLMPLNSPPISVMRHKSSEPAQANGHQPTVLVATVDPGISTSMREMLQMYPLKTVWARGVDEVRAVLAAEHVAACFCGFWLVDGTYRDVVRHLKNQPVEIPAIIVCPPACPHEYRDYLAALNIRAFDVFCHPYRKTDLERILEAAIQGRGGLGRSEDSAGVPTNPRERRGKLRKAG